MRAALIRSYGDPDVVEVAEVDDPVVGPDSLLVEVAAAGINPVDWKIVAGYLQGAFPAPPADDPRLGRRRHRQGRRPGRRRRRAR